MANWLLRRLIRESILVNGATICLNSQDPVVSGALNLGLYEREEIRFFMDHFKHGMSFVDVGANIGLYTALAIRAGADSVLAIEPMPENFNFLSKTVAANTPSRKVFLERAAAGREPGSMGLHANPDNKGDNRLYPDDLLKHRITDQVETLDALCIKHKIRRTDFLKIDVQGAEMQVLQGAASLLTNSPPKIIMTEFRPHGLRSCGSEPADFLNIFNSFGFELRELRNHKLHPFQSSQLISTTTGRKYRNVVAFQPGAEEKLS